MVRVDVASFPARFFLFARSGRVGAYALHINRLLNSSGAGEENEREIPELQVMTSREARRGGACAPEGQRRVEQQEQLQQCRMDEPNALRRINAWIRRRGGAPSMSITL